MSQIVTGQQINGRWYLTTTPIANWNYRRMMLRNGMGYIEEPHPKGKIVRYVNLDRCIEVGFDEMGEEKLPRHAYRN